MKRLWPTFLAIIIMFEAFLLWNKIDNFQKEMVKLISWEMEWQYHYNWVYDRLAWIDNTITEMRRQWINPIKDAVVEEETESIKQLEEEIKWYDTELCDELNLPNWFWHCAWREFPIDDIIGYHSTTNVKCEWIYLYERLCPQNDLWCNNQKSYWFKKINWDEDTVRLEPEYVIKNCKEIFSF